MPIKTLAQAMNIDISSRIQEFIDELIEQVQDAPDFVKASYVIQLSTQAYGKKVDYLNQLLENLLLDQPQRKTRKRRTERQMINDLTLLRDFDLNFIKFDDFYQKCKEMQTKRGILVRNKQIQSLLQARQETNNQKIQMGPIYNCLIYNDQLMSIVQRNQQYMQKDKNIDDPIKQLEQDENIQNDQIQQQYNDLDDEDLNIEMLEPNYDQQNDNQQDQQESQQTNIQENQQEQQLDLQNFNIQMLSSLGKFVDKNIKKYTQIDKDMINDFKIYKFKRYQIKNSQHQLQVPQPGIIYKFQEQDQSFNENNILMRYTTPEKIYEGIQTPIVQNFFTQQSEDVGQLLRSEVVKDETFQNDYIYDNIQDNQDLTSEIQSVEIQQNSIPSNRTQNSIQSESKSQVQKSKKKVIQNLFTSDYIQWIKKLESLVKKHNEFNVQKVKGEIMSKKEQNEVNLDDLSNEIQNTKTRCFVSALFLANEGKLDIQQKQDQIIFEFNN